MGISSGATYSTIFFVNIKASVFSSNQLSAIPLIVSVSSHITPNSAQSLPYYVQISYPPAVFNSSTLVGVWVGNFYLADVVDSSQFGYLSVSIASSLHAVLQLNNGVLQTGDARLFIFGDVIFAYLTYSGFYQGFLVRQDSSNPNRLVGSFFSLQQGLDYTVTTMYFSKVIPIQPNTVSVSSPVLDPSTLVGVWVGNFYLADVVDSSQFGYLSVSITSSLHAVLQLNNGVLQTGDARLFIFGDVIFAYLTYSGFYQGFLVRPDSSNPNRLVGSFFSLQQGLDYTVTTMYLVRNSAGSS
eukprot:gene22956-31262_t